MSTCESLFMVSFTWGSLSVVLHWAGPSWLSGSQIAHHRGKNLSTLHQVVPHSYSHSSPSLFLRTKIQLFTLLIHIYGLNLLLLTLVYKSRGMIPVRLLPSEFSGSCTRCPADTKLDSTDCLTTTSPPRMRNVLSSCWSRESTWFQKQCRWVWLPLLAFKKSKRIRKHLWEGSCMET